MAVTQYNVLDENVKAKHAAIPDKVAVVFDDVNGYDYVKHPAAANDVGFRGISLTPSLTAVNKQGDYGELLIRRHGLAQAYVSEAFTEIGQEAYVANTDGDIGPVVTNATPIEYRVIAKLRGCPENGDVPGAAGDVAEFQLGMEYLKTV